MPWLGIPNPKNHFGILIFWDSHQDKDPKASHTGEVSKSFHVPDPSGADGILGMCPKPRKSETKTSKDLYLEGLSRPILTENQDFPRKQLFFPVFLNPGSSMDIQPCRNSSAPTFPPDPRISIPGKTTIPKNPQSKTLKLHFNWIFQRVIRKCFQSRSGLGL